MFENITVLDRLANNEIMENEYIYVSHIQTKETTEKKKYN